jgi:hypothetical protein
MYEEEHSCDYEIPPVEEGSNTSPVAPRIVGGDEKGTQGYNWVTLLLGGCKYGDLALQVGGVSNLRK